MFIIDDFLVWIWCRITNCEKKPEGPQEAKAHKDAQKIVVVEEVKASAKENKTNGTNATEEEAPTVKPKG